MIHFGCRVAITPLFLLLLLGSNPMLVAGVYGEHKIIGDQAFRRVVSAIRNDPGWRGRIDSILVELTIELHEDIYIWKRFSRVIDVGFGDMNGLSADHVGNPYELRSQLVDPASGASISAGLHQVYMRSGTLAARDLPLTAIDFDYPLLAFANISHFYRYGWSLHRHLAEYDLQLVDALSEKKGEESLFDALVETNCIAKYLMVHEAARRHARRAGELEKDDRKAAIEQLEVALLFEAYADHLLQDAFSAGHLVCDRTRSGSLTHDLPLHDLYGEIGVKVFNLRGDRWRAHGDGSMNTPFGLPSALDSNIRSFNVELAIEANVISLQEIFDGYEEGVSGRVVDVVGDEGSAEWLLARNGALRLIPVPFYTPDTEIGFRPVWNDGDPWLHDRAEVGRRIGTTVAAGVAMVPWRNELGSDNPERRYWLTFTMRGAGLINGMNDVAHGGPGIGPWIDLNLGLQLGTSPTMVPRASLDPSPAGWWQVQSGAEIHFWLGSPFSVGIMMGMRDSTESDGKFGEFVVTPYLSLSSGAIASYAPQLFGAPRWDDNPFYHWNLRAILLVDITDRGLGHLQDRPIERLHVGFEFDLPPLIDLVW